MVDDLEEVLNEIPRVEKGALNARVWLDASGRLNILPEGGGWIGIEEETLNYVQADIAWEQG